MNRVENRPAERRVVKANRAVHDDDRKVEAPGTIDAPGPGTGGDDQQDFAAQPPLPNPPRQVLKGAP